MCYVNQGMVLLAKGIYLEFVVIRQVMAVTNADLSINLETHVFKDNEVLLYVPVYNKATVLYGGFKKKLGQITLRGDDQECFFSYGYSKEKSTLLYCYMKQTFAEYFSLYSL